MESFVTLGGYVSTQKGFAFKSKWFVDSGREIVKVSDFTEDSICPTNLVKISNDLGEQYSRYSLSTGDVVIQTVGSWPSNPASVVGKTIRVPKSVDGALLNQNAVKIIPSEELHGGFLYYLLRSEAFKEFIIGTAQGAASQASITLDAIKRYKFLLPQFEVQADIAEYLENYDNLIENNNRRITILEDMAQTLYREWFVNFRYPNHEDNLDADGKPKLIDSPLDQIPEGWEVKPLGDLVEFKRITIKKGSVPDNTPYMGLEHFPRKSIALSDWEEVSDIGSNKLAFNRGDILFGKIRPNFHKVGVAQVDGLCSSDTFVLSPKDSEHHSLITMVTFSNEFVAQAVQTSQGSKMPRASWDVLKEFAVCLPDSNALERFNSAANPAIEQIRVLSLKNRNLKQQRDMLLPKLISGQIEL
jgi:type I restriction enzyme S subunit